DRTTGAIRTAVFPPSSHGDLVVLGVKHPKSSCGCAACRVRSLRSSRSTFCAPGSIKVSHLVPFPTTSSPLARALPERNHDQPTPVRLAVLADDAVGRDLLVSAQTGSGKTVAYGLAMAKDLLGDAERFEPAAAPLALIVAPTRELALQVQRELAWLYEHAD